MELSAFFQFIGQFGLIAVFFIIALEYACIPVPSEHVLPIAGAFAARNGIPFWAVLAVSVAAGVFGSLLCYLAGYYGGGRLLERLRAKHPKTGSGLDSARAWMERFGPLSVLVGRVLPLCRTWISLIAGMSRLSPARFIVFSAAGITVWNAALVGLGFRLGLKWEDASSFARRYQMLLMPVVAVVVAVIIFRIVKGRKSKG